MKIWIGLGAIFALVLTTLCVRLVVGPRALAIIDLSPIERPEQAGILAFRGLRDVLDDNSFLAIGVADAVSGSAEIVSGLFKAMTAAHFKFVQWQGQAPFVDIEKSIASGAKAFVIFPQETLTGSFRQHFEAAAREQMVGVGAGTEAATSRERMQPVVLLIHPIDVNNAGCRDQKVMFNVYDDQFLPCSSLALLGRRFRRLHKQGGHFMALTSFGKRTYVLYVQ